MRMLILLAVFIGTLCSADLTVEAAWSRATAPTAVNGVAYATLVNAGAAEDRLVSAATPVAATVELHTIVTEGATKRMVPVEAVPVPAGGSTVLKPGSWHLMLLDLKRPLVEGEVIPLTMTFARAGALTVDVTVAGIGATAAPAPASAPATGAAAK